MLAYPAANGIPLDWAARKRYSAAPAVSLLLKGLIVSAAFFAACFIDKRVRGFVTRAVRVGAGARAA